VESEGRHSQGDAEPADAVDNVVRFPRDWFGPPEELVPFGPSASPAETVDPAAPVALDPDAFWGENASSIQNVVQVPRVVDVGPNETEVPSETEVPFAPEHATVAAAAIGPRKGWAGRLAGRVVAAAAVGIVALMFGLGQVGSSPGPAHPVMARVAHAVAARPALGPAIDRLIRQRARAGRAETHASGTTLHHAVRSGSRSTDSAARSRSRTSAAASRAPMQANVAAPPQTSEMVSQTSAPAPRPGSGDVASAAAAGSSGTGGGSGGSGAPTGPQGAGSPFGPGHLG
jgi:hypothetical protein